MSKSKDGELEPFEITGENKVIFDIESTDAGLKIYVVDEFHSDFAASIELDPVTVTELRDYLNRYIERS